MPSVAVPAPISPPTARSADELRRADAVHTATFFALLALLYGTLPVTLRPASDELSGETCLTLADVAPVPGVDRRSELERCTAVLPSDAELLADLGREYERSGELARAENRYAQALAVDPGFADVRLRLGHLLLHRGAAAEARRQAEAALAVQPNRAALLELLREATQAQGGR